MNVHGENLKSLIVHLTKEIEAEVRKEKQKLTKV